MMETERSFAWRRPGSSVCESRLQGGYPVNQCKLAGRSAEENWNIRKVSIGNLQP
jgi:hypothetical protein